MPETRYIEVSDGKGKILRKETFTVSDEQLKKEKALEQIRTLRAKSLTTWTQLDLAKLINALIEVLGVDT